MTTYFESIVEFNNSRNAAFREHQQKRIAQLRQMERDKAMGKHISIEPIIRNLQSAGILDANGDLAAPYKTSDD